jgi:hypothetical protein
MHIARSVRRQLRERRMDLCRTFVVCCALCLPACIPAPGSPALLQTQVTGDWSGTFESSWGALPVRATIANEPYSQGIYGSYVLDGGHATGSLGGALQTHDKDTPGLLQGSLTISYRMANGETCRSMNAVTYGSATSTWFTFQTDGFPNGNCPDSPTNIRVTLRR